MGVATEAIRNIAIAGHGATGKTTIFENLLAAGGSIERAETIASGKTVSDHTDEEIERKISIHLALGYINQNNVMMNLFDTPGASDFVGEVVTAFRICESAVVVIGAKEGVQIETVKIWRRLEARSKPRVLYINKLDSDRADFAEALATLSDRFSATFVPIVIPIDGAEGFRGVVDLIAQKAYLIPEPGESEKAVDIPDDIKETVEEYRTSLIEAAAEGDDALMEKYFEEETLSDEEILAGLNVGFKENRIVPVLCGAAELGSGIIPLLDFLAKNAPSPVGAMEPQDDKKTGEGEEAEEAVTAIDAGGSPSGFIFRTTIDQFSGKLSFTKVITGTIKPDIDLYNPKAQSKQRIGKIYKCLGKKIVDTDSIGAGDIGILVKLDSAHNFNTLCSLDDEVTYASIAVPQPVHSVAVFAASKKDEDKMNQFLQRAADEDPTFTIRYNPETKQTVISGMGELHIMMILDRIKEKQNIDIETKVPRVPYRETITKTADAEYAHKKQTGGHGQYGKVVMQINPLERGLQYTFENVIKGGAISRGYIPRIEKGILEGMESGVLAGYPVVDVGAKILDGKEHPVDSSEMSFKLAAKGALMIAIEKAGPVLLEPVVNLRVFTNDEYVGDILSDLSSRRGRVSGQEALGGGIVEIDAQVPQAELLRYSIDLRSITSGTASFEMEFDHYNPISGKIADDVIAASKAAEEA